jgi:hypothetical protein
MDERLVRLAEALKDKVQVSQVEIDALIAEVRAEAFAEARVILKDLLIQAILDRALLSSPREAAHPATDERTGKGGDSFVPPTNGDRAASISTPIADPLPTPIISNPQPPVSVPETLGEKELIALEIESIRKKIAENNRVLSGASASSSRPGQTVAAAGPSTTEHASDSEIKPPSSQELGYYVYCIVRGAGSNPVEGLPEHGIDPAYPVYALSQQALTAVVSQVSLGEFGQAELEANLNDLQWLETKVRAHESVLEAVMASGACVPMRLCTIYRSEQRVQELMAQYYDSFAAALDRLQGKQEWGIKLYCDGQVLASKISEVSDRVKDLTAQTKGKSGGAAYFLKKKLEDAIAEEVERIGDESAQRSHDCLAGYAAAATTNSLQDKETTHRKDDMLLNASYLVPAGQLAAFQDELENLQNEYGAQGFSFVLTGPWPPYNFATINLEEVSDEPVSG